MCQWLECFFNRLTQGSPYIYRAARLRCAVFELAGWSEVLVIAYGQAYPEFVAADLLSQAEHGSDSQVVLVLPETADSSAIESELQKQLNALPRKEIASMALEKSFILRVPDSDAA